MNVKTTLIGGPLDGLDVVVDSDLLCVYITHVSIVDNETIVQDGDYFWDSKRFKYVHKTILMAGVDE